MMRMAGSSTKSVGGLRAEIFGVFGRGVVENECTMSPSFSSFSTSPSHFPLTSLRPMLSPSPSPSLFFVSRYCSISISTDHLFVVDSLDKHMQNEKELIGLRRFMPATRTTRARSAQFACGANYLAPGRFKFCLRRELPVPGTKGGYFVFVWRVGT